MGEYNTYEGDYQKDERGHSSKKTKQKENADTVKGTSQEKYASSTAEQKASQTHVLFVLFSIFLAAVQSP